MFLCTLRNIICIFIYVYLYILYIYLFISRKDPKTNKCKAYNISKLGDVLARDREKNLEIVLN